MTLCCHPGVCCANPHLMTIGMFPYVLTDACIEPKATMIVPLQVSGLQRLEASYLYNLVQPYCPQRNLGCNLLTWLTWVLRQSLSTRVSCFQSCGQLRRQTEPEAALFPKVFTDLHKEETEVPLNSNLFLRLQPQLRSGKRGGRKDRSAMSWRSTPRQLSVNKA